MLKPVFIPRRTVPAGTVVTVEKLLTPGYRGKTRVAPATRHTLKAELRITNPTTGVCDPLDPARSEAEACERVNHLGYRVYVYTADIVTEESPEEQAARLMAWYASPAFVSLCRIRVG